MAKETSSVLRHTAREVKMYRVFMRLLPILAGGVATLLTLTYVAAVLYGRYSSFTVSVQKHDALKYGLSLDYTPEFKSPTSNINAPVAVDITCIDGKTLPAFLDNVDGVHHGDNYAAYTFYCRNAGSEIVTYQYELSIANMTLNVERAVRIRLYVNGEETTYAHTATDGSGPEPDTVAFKTTAIVTSGTVENFSPGDMTKYTVIVWLEGNDPDCTDDVLGGEFKLDMKMNVIGIEAS